MFHVLRWISKGLVLLLCTVIALCTAINIIMYFGSQNHNMHMKKDMAIVLGASVHGSKLSDALKARMEAAIVLYQNKLVDSILLTGDGSHSFYSETAAMKKFALKRGIPERSILTDEKGYNTYLSMLRAKNVYQAKTVYVVSQNFHLPRAVWIGRQIGLDTDGVNAGTMERRWYYESREFVARVKDFLQLTF